MVLKFSRNHQATRVRIYRLKMYSKPTALCSTKIRGTFLCLVIFQSQSRHKNNIQTSNLLKILNAITFNKFVFIMLDFKNIQNFLWNNLPEGFYDSTRLFLFTFNFFVLFNPRINMKGIFRIFEVFNGKTILAPWLYEDVHNHPFCCLLCVCVFCFVVFFLLLVYLFPRI